MKKTIIPFFIIPILLLILFASLYLSSYKSNQKKENKKDYFASNCEIMDNVFNKKELDDSINHILDNIEHQLSRTNSKNLDNFQYIEYAQSEVWSVKYIILSYIKHVYVKERENLLDEYNPNDEDFDKEEFQNSINDFDKEYNFQLDDISLYLFGLEDEINSSFNDGRVDSEEIEEIVYWIKSIRDFTDKHLPPYEYY